MLPLKARTAGDKGEGEDVTEGQKESQSQDSTTDRKVERGYARRSRMAVAVSFINAPACAPTEK